MEYIQIIKMSNGQYAPVDSRDLPLFKHCTDGHISVTCIDDYIEVFNVHGVGINVDHIGNNYDPT